MPDQTVNVGFAPEGMVSTRSLQTVDAATEKLSRILESRGVKIFALIDHSGEAAQAGYAMRNTKLVIFGNPKAGTPVMLAAPTVALDLPLKILIWEDAEGQTWLSYNSTEYLRQRHALPEEVLPNIAVIEALAAAAAS